MRSNLWDASSKRLRRSYCRGPSQVAGFDSDYAFLASGLLDLFAATGDTRWLAWAEELQGAMDDLFWDHNSGKHARPSLLNALNVRLTMIRINAASWGRNRFHSIAASACINAEISIDICISWQIPLESKADRRAVMRKR